MTDEFFDHIKHRLAETSVPDPEQAWRQMNVLLDASGISRKSSIRYLHWWQAAACLLAVSAAWAMYHEWPGIRHAQVATAKTKGHARTPIQAPAQDPTLAQEGLAQGGLASGGTAPGGTAPGNHPVRRSQTMVAYGRISNRRVAFTGSQNTSTEQPEEPGAANDLSISLTDRTFLLDRPLAGRLMGVGRNVAGAASLVHIHAPRHVPRWSFTIGIAANTPGSFRNISNNGQTKWEPGVYPIAEAWYRLSPRWSLGLGLAAPAPIAYTNAPTNTDLYVAADSLQNNTQTTTSQRLARLTYLDIPLMMRFELFNHLTVEAGIQASYLLSRQDETNSTNAPVRGLIALANTNIYYPGNHDPLHSQVMKIDPRGLLGLNYRFHRFNAGLQYEAGLRVAVNQTDDQGNPVSERTNVMRMTVGYRLN
jgi:hypothetical protein